MLGVQLRMGCDQIAGSLARLDVCDVCGGDGKSCVGCDGVMNSGETDFFVFFLFFFFTFIVFFILTRTFEIEIEKKKTFNSLETTPSAH